MYHYLNAESIMGETRENWKQQQTYLLNIILNRNHNNNNKKKGMEKQSIPAFSKKGSEWTKTSHMVGPLKIREASKLSND